MCYYVLITVTKHLLTQLTEQVYFVSWFEGRHGGRSGRCLATFPLWSGHRERWMLECHSFFVILLSQTSPDEAPGTVPATSRVGLPTSGNLW